MGVPGRCGIVRDVKKTAPRGGRGSNQYQTRGSSAPVPRADMDDVEAIAAAFDPESDAAWEWSGLSAHRARLEANGFDAMSAATSGLDAMLNAGWTIEGAVDWLSDGGKPDDPEEWLALCDERTRSQRTTLARWSESGWNPTETAALHDRWNDPLIPAALRDAGINALEVLDVVTATDAKVAQLPLPAEWDNDRVIALYRGAGVKPEHVAMSLLVQRRVPLQDAMDDCFGEWGFPPVSKDGRSTGNWRRLISVCTAAGVDVDDTLEAIYKVDDRSGLAAANPAVHGPPEVVMEGIADADTIRRSARLLSRWCARHHRRTIDDAVHEVYLCGWLDSAGGWRLDPVAKVIREVFPDARPDDIAVQFDKHKRLK